MLPLKGGAAAKSRLGAPAGVAAAIALDTLDAVLATRATGALAQVLVVTPDPALAAAARGAGAVVVPEPPGGAGLVDAVRAGLAASSGPVAVLLGDLPALHPQDLAAALAACAAHPVAFVPDAEGAGTVLLAARRPAGLAPRFGTGSAKLHADDGAVRLELDLPRLRRDVDTRADLREATALGLGPRTRAALG